MSVRRPLVTSHRASTADAQYRPARTRRLACRVASWITAASIWLGATQAQAQGPEPVPEAGSANPQFTLPMGDASGSAGYPQASYPPIGASMYGEEPPAVGGYGTKARIGAQAGTTVGQYQPITNFDLSPYMFQDNLYLFGEGRIALGNDGKTGGSLGAGARYFIPQMNSIIGSSGWLDIDNTRGTTFHQWGVGAEFLSEFFDFRGNIYAPYGAISKVTSVKFEQGSQKFIDRPAGDVLAGEAQGTYLSFQRRVFSSTALQGFDTLFTIPMPGNFAQTLNLEASAGFYGYEAKDGSVDQTYGWRARFDIDLFERLSHMYLEVNNDRTFKTNVAFGADINYWHKLEHRPRLGHSQYNRLAEWVRRNRTVVALESSALKAPETAINPLTGRPYVVYQVLQTDEVSHGGNGTLANPFQNLQDAINATGTSLAGRPSDFIQYVRGNSVIQSGITLGPGLDGVQVIGEQGAPTVGIPVQGLSSNVFLPNITPTPFNAPVIRNVSGTNAVTLNSNNTTFAAINIENVTGGDAIFAGTGISGGRVQEVAISNVSGGNGVNLQGVTGAFTFNNVQISNIEGTAVNVVGGNANIQFSGVSDIDNTANTHGSHGYAVNVQDTLAGNVDLRALTIQDTGGQGIRVYGTTPGSSLANVSFGKTTLTDTVVPAAVGGEIDPGAVYIRNHSASVTFADALTINGINTLGGDSFVVENLGAAGQVFAQGDVSIQNRRGHGIHVINSQDSGSAGLMAPNNVRFQGAVSVSGLGSGFLGDDSAVLFESSSGGLIFANGLTVNGSRGDGVEITSGLGVPDGTDRAFVQVVNGNISNVSGAGGATGVSFHVHDVTKSAFTVNSSVLNISSRGSAGSTGLLGAGIRVNNFAGAAAFALNTSVNNQLGSFANAVDIQNNVSTGLNSGVSFTTLNVDNQLGAGSYGVRVANNINPSAGVSFGALNVNSTNAIGVSLEDNSRVSIGSGALDSTNARAIEVFTNVATTNQVHSINLTSADATGADYGIFVDKSDGSFSVVGDGSTAGSGGTISGMSAAGAFFRDTQQVNLNLMNLTGNLRGVEAVRLLPLDGGQNGLILNGMTISASASEGIYAQDVPNFQLLNSIITSNGSTNSQEQIELFATIGTYDINGDGVDEVLPYSFVFNNNSVIDGTTIVTGTDMISIHSVAGIVGGIPMSLNFTDNGSPQSTTNLNTITSNRALNRGALDVTWTGPVNANIVNNQFSLLNGVGQVGLDFNVTGPANINYVNNGLTASGDLATGVRANLSQASTLTISGNQVLNANNLPISGSGFFFSGLSSTAMDLTLLSAGNNVSINNNVIEFTDYGSRAIVFPRIVGAAGNTSVSIGGNTIDRVVNVLDAYTEQGVQFQVVQGTISLNSSAGTNLIYSNGTLLNNFAPYYYNFQMPGGASGITQLSINNVFYP